LVRESLQEGKIVLGTEGNQLAVGSTPPQLIRALHCLVNWLAARLRWRSAWRSWCWCL